MTLSKKLWVNIIMLFSGVAVASLHRICKDSCLYLKGTFFGVALDYLGIGYMGLLILSFFLKKDLIFLSSLSFGIGAEMYLLGFQVIHGVYCSYCLAFGAILFLLFFLNFERSKKIFIALSILVGFIVFSLFFEGAVTPVYAEDLPLTSFGKGPIKVRLYTDYFCGPCRSLEPALEPVIRSLVKKGSVTVTFIDTPVHPHTTLYAKYYLYALNYNREKAGEIKKKDVSLKKRKKTDTNFEDALRVRSVLFEAAKENITEKEKLEGFIRNKGVDIKSFDTSPVFGILSGYLKEDMIDRTPTCVIYKAGKKERFTGPDIVKALEALR